MTAKKSFIILVISTLAILQPGHAQIVKEDINLADDAFRDGDFYLASTYYYKVLENDTNKLDIAYKYAESCRLFNSYAESAKWYKYVARNDEKEKFPLSNFYYALMLKNTGRYLKAKEAFSNYYSKHRLDRDYFSKKANIEIEACDFAESKIKDSLKVNIEHLSYEINTPYSEFGALQLKDSLLVYSSLRYVVSDESVPATPDLFQSNIYSSNIDNETYQKPSRFSQIINEAEVHTANICFTRDHKTAYFTKCRAIDYSGLRCEIYQSSYKDGSWEKPEKLNDMINMHGYTSTHPCIVEGEMKIFCISFPTDREARDNWISGFQE